MAELRQHVAEELTDPDAVLVLDLSAFPNTTLSGECYLRRVEDNHMKLMRNFLFSFAIIVVIALTIFSAIFYYERGYFLTVRFPFIYWDPDRYMNSRETCNALMGLGFGLKDAIEKSLDLGKCESIEEIIFMLKKHELAPDSIRTKDGWGNSFKVQTALNHNPGTILIYSDSPNAFAVPPVGYNLFVELVISSDRKVRMTVTTISDRGRIVLKTY